MDPENVNKIINTDNTSGNSDNNNDDNNINDSVNQQCYQNNIRNFAEETKKLLPTSSRKFMIIPSANSSLNTNSNLIFRRNVELRPLFNKHQSDTSPSSAKSLIPSPLSTYLLPRHFNSMRSVNSGSIIQFFFFCF